MASLTNDPRPANFWKWLDPRGRAIGNWAFILNRLSALGLTFYLFLHLIILGSLARGPEAYGQFLELIHSPIFVFGEWIVVVGGLIHGLNGLRIALNSFGIAVPYQRQLFYVLMVLAAIGSLYFAVRMFTA